eukprot:2023942-Lingulodinium_polyedra.AAC.1
MSSPQKVASTVVPFLACGYVLDILFQHAVVPFQGALLAQWRAYVYVTALAVMAVARALLVVASPGYSAWFCCTTAVALLHPCLCHPVAR